MAEAKSFGKRVQIAVEEAGNHIVKRIEGLGDRLKVEEKFTSTLSKSYVPLFLLGVDLDEWTQATDRAHVSKLKTGRCYLDVFDLPLSTSDPAYAGNKALEVRKLSDRETALESLFAQRSGTIRVYVDDTDQPPHGTDSSLKSLISQWRDTSPEHGFQLKGSAFFKYEPKDQFLSRQMRNSAWAHILSTVRLEHDSIGPQATISHQILAPASLIRLSNGEEWRYPLDMTEGLVAEILRLETIYRQWRTEDNWRYLFLLQYHHAFLNQYQDFLQTYAKEYVRYRQDMFDARKSQLRQWALNQLTSDSYQLRQMTNTSEELIAAVELLLEVTKPVLERASSEDAPEMHEFAMLEQELRGSCKDQTSRLQRMADDLDHHLKFLDLNRNMRQSDSVQTLTLLATVFLPLSLAAGVLSMSTRFKDLGDLLYDLFGVVIIIGAVVMLLLLLFLVISIIKEYLANHHKSRPRFIGKLVAVSIVPYGLLVLVSFLVGMFKDVVLGAKILGFGTLAYPFSFYIFYIPMAIIAGICVGLALALSFVLSFWDSMKRSKKKEADPEVVRHPSNGGGNAPVSETVVSGVKIVGDGDNSDVQETKTATRDVVRS